MISRSLICGLKSCVPPQLRLAELPLTRQHIPRSQGRGGSNNMTTAQDNVIFYKPFQALLRSSQGVRSLQICENNKPFIFLVFQASGISSLGASFLFPPPPFFFDIQSGFKMYQLLFKLPVLSL